MFTITREEINHGALVRQANLAVDMGIIDPRGVAVHGDSLVFASLADERTAQLAAEAADLRAVSEAIGAARI